MDDIKSATPPGNLFHAWKLHHQFINFKRPLKHDIAENAPPQPQDCPLKIVAGHQKIPYYVYPGVLASSGSPVLEARASDRWSGNGLNEAIDWSDVDEETVGCVLSYLNYEDYDVSSPLDEEERCSEDKEDDTMSSSQQEIDTPETTEASLIPEEPTTSDEQTTEQPLTPSSQYLETGLPAETAQKTQAAGESFSKVPNACGQKLGDIALIHAKVYCFAHHLLFSRLEELALERLSQLLLQCEKPEKSFLLCLTEAVRLIYDSTPRSKTSDPARLLLSQYIATKYAQIPQEIIGDLVMDGGDFAFDLTRRLALIISTREKSYESLKVQIQEKEKEILAWQNWNEGLVAKKKAKKSARSTIFSRPLESTVDPDELLEA